MDSEEFAKQYAEYLVLNRKGNLSKEEKAQMSLAYDHIKDYVISGEELIGCNLFQYFPDGVLINEELDNQEKLFEKLEEIRKEISGKQGTLVNRLNSILSSE